jgi:hypothetical protein
MLNPMTVRTARRPRLALEQPCDYFKRHSSAAAFNRDAIKTYFAALRESFSEAIHCFAHTRE